MIISFAKSSSCSEHKFCSSGFLYSGSKQPVTESLSQPVRIIPVSARCPISNPKASRSMDFPAPVSPLNTVKPFCKSKSSLSIKTTFLIDKDFSIIAVPSPFVFLHPTGQTVFMILLFLVFWKRSKFFSSLFWPLSSIFL